MALHNAFDDRKTADRAAAVLALVGLVNIPIIHFSVEWWNTLHQGATISKFEKPSMDADMLKALLVFIFAFQVYFFTVLMQRIKSEILKREKMTGWVRTIVEGKQSIKGKQA